MATDVRYIGKKRRFLAEYSELSTTYLFEWNATDGAVKSLSDADATLITTNYPTLFILDAGTTVADGADLSINNIKKTDEFSITAENSFSQSLFIRAGLTGEVFLYGTWVATVNLQESTDNVTFYDTDDVMTGNTIYPFLSKESKWYRIGVKTGDFTSGTVQGYVSREKTVNELTTEN